MNTQTKDAIIERLIASPEAERIARDLDVEALATRRRLKEEIADADKELEAKLPSTLAALERATKGVEDARAALKAAEEKRQQAYAADRAVRHAYDRARDIRSAQLIETAPTEIDAFIRELDGLAQHVRHRGPTVELGGRHWLTGKKLPDSSDYTAIVATLAAIGSARSAAEVLKLDALAAGEVVEKIAELRATIETATEEAK